MLPRARTQPAAAVVKSLYALKPTGGGASVLDERDRVPSIRFRPYTFSRLAPTSVTYPACYIA